MKVIDLLAALNTKINAQYKFFNFSLSVKGNSPPK